MVFPSSIRVLFEIISSDLNYFISIFSNRKASSLVITSSYGFSAHYFRSHIVILLFCTLRVEVQGEFTGLSMECASPLSSVIEYNIEPIVSMNCINSHMNNLRCRKSSTQGCTPPCNCTKEHHFRSNDSLSVVSEFLIYLLIV